jgi:uncharacterized protein
VSLDIFESAFASIVEEVASLRPHGTIVDAHTHLGLDEDGRSLDLASLLAALDEVDGEARAAVFPLHDPERRPAYRVPNDRVLGWAGESDGRLYPFCRLDPREDPVAEAERCLARGAMGIKLHPRAQAFGFGDGLARGIFEAARDAGVPILIHAGRGMGQMDDLAELAQAYPEVPLILAHAAIADQGMFASRLAGHPAVVYDTSVFAALDVLELFARVPPERVVFASDIPYGRPVLGLFLALRVAAYAGLGEQTRSLLVGGTMQALVERRPLPAPSAAAVAEVRPVNGRLARVGYYLAGAFGAMMADGPPPQPPRGLPGIALARAVTRDPDPGAAGPALERIDALLEAAERMIRAEDEDSVLVTGLLAAANTIAVTEPQREVEDA